MPKKSKAHQARINNLRKREDQHNSKEDGQSAHLPVSPSPGNPLASAPTPAQSHADSRHATVEEVVDVEYSGLAKPLLDMDDMLKDWESGEMEDDSGDEESSESGVEEVEDDAGSFIMNQAKLESFNSMLLEAQRVAEEEETRRKAQPGKRGKYTGRSKRTMQEMRRKQRLAKERGENILDAFERMKMKAKGNRAGSASQVEVVVIDDSASNSADDVIAQSVVDSETIEGSPLLSASTSIAAEPETPPVFVVPPTVQAVPDGSEDAKAKVNELLRHLREGRRPADFDPPTQSDHQLENWKDLPKLRRARAALTVKSKDKLLDVLFRSRIAGMLGALNLYLDDKLSYTWREASLVAAVAQGHGSSHARNLRTWLHQYLDSDLKKLPFHRYGKLRGSILHDEDFSQAIQLHLQEKAKDGYIRAQHIVDFVSQNQEMQDLLEKMGVKRRSISLSQAYRWLRVNGYRYGRKRKGMYIDGHEREDVVAYREEFIERWAEYEKRMVTYDNDGNILEIPPGFKLPNPATPFELVLVTHDESTFYENDRRNLCWSHESDKPVPMKKGEGASIMISDFLTLKWGRLVFRDKETGEIIDPRVVFRAGKNRDGWFASEDLLLQVDRAIDAFEGMTNGRAQALFMFDNAPSHQKRAPDALSARYMPKNPSETWDNRGGPRMRDGTLPNGESQSFYFPDDHPEHPGWFKGMEQIIRERGLWPADGLLAQCTDFKCAPGKTDCCCRRLLFTQPDFCNQKSALEELITRRGHICDFYPKYHCELNFIEQYWGAAKLRYRNSPQTKNQEEMEKNVLSCLDEVSRVQMIRYANRSARFISAYKLGMTGGEAAWVNKRYHGHRTLPPLLLAEVRREVAESGRLLD